MPFSIKRFTIHRSSSLPAHSGRPADGKKGEGHEYAPPNGKTLKKSASQDERKGKHARSRGLPTSQSVDSAELRRIGYALTPIPIDAEDQPDTMPQDRAPMAHGAPEYSHRFPPASYGGAPCGPPPPERQPATLPNRWRSSGKSRSAATDPRGMYDQVAGGEVRRVVVRRNGVRFQGECWDKTPSREGRWAEGRRGGRCAPSGGVRQNEWLDEGPPGPNGSRGSHSMKRQQPRRHHGAGGDHAEPPRPPMDAESHLQNQRNLLYTPPPSVYDDDPGIMSEVETSATGFRRANKARSTLPVVRTPSKTQERPMGKGRK